MSSDRSRSTDRSRHGYTGVVAQQGRVTLDRDFNALQGLTADRVAADARDFVGSCGTPDDGFAISLPVASPPFWNPPAPGPGSPPGTSGDFLIAPGTMYVGGERVTWAAEQDGKSITYSYFDQPDWPAPAPVSNVVRELVYLELTEQEVSAVEDPDLREVALGGPDTTQRLKLLRRVRRMAVTDRDCTAAWATAVKLWNAEGWRFDSKTMRLLPRARLQVGFANDTGSGDPCDPVATGGYLGADNQLIRVRIEGGGANLLWGYDNASFIYRIDSVSSDRTKLTLAGAPPDAFHIPQKGQVVEILPTAAVLGREPDETDPTGQHQILRVAADVHGELRRLAQPYGPLPGDPTNYIVLDNALPASMKQSALPLFLRVWQAQLPFQVGTPVTLADPATGISTGVNATISSSSGNALSQGAFWQIAVRPATPQGAYPEDLLTAPQPADGPRRWVCPLAVIDWGERIIIDCRSHFDDLVALTRRRPGCCTVAITPADVRKAMPLQNLIDRAAAMGDRQGVTVCLAPGTYPLPQPLRLDSRHSRLTIESCDGAAILSVDPQAEPALFADGLVVLTQSSAITLRQLTLLPALVPMPLALIDVLLGRATPDFLEQGRRVFGRPFVSFGVRAVNAPGLVIDRCIIQLGELRTNAAADLVAAGVFVQGVCYGLTVRGCTFHSSIVPTYTPLAVNPAIVSPGALERFNKAIAKLNAIASPLSPPASLPAAAPELAVAVRHLRVDAGVDAIVAKRLAAVSAAPGNLLSPIVATAGVLAIDHAVQNSPGASHLACDLGDAAIRENAFTGLTFATWISATASELRLQDNKATGGVAGLWLEVPGATTPPNPAGNTAQIYTQITMFEELHLLDAFAATLPLPSSPLPSRVPTRGIGAENELLPIIRGQRLLVLFVLSNHMDCNHMDSNGRGAATAALFMALYAKPSLPSLSVIVSANHLISVAPYERPTALLTLPLAQPCCITGNAIFNPTNFDSRSLWLVIEDTAQGHPTNLLSITGNALKGSSDLTQITRTAGLPPHRQLNADPT
jgi:Family of unknown function (DUF6519)